MLLVWCCWWLLLFVVLIFGSSYIFVSDAKHALKANSRSNAVNNISQHPNNINHELRLPRVGIRILCIGELLVRG